MRNPGDEISGEIETVDKDVKDSKKVIRFLGPAVQVLVLMPSINACPKERRWLKTGLLSYGEAVAVCYAGLTALPFLGDKAKIKGGQKILINGSSRAIGTSSVQLARYYGAEVKVR